MYDHKILGPIVKLWLKVYHNYILKKVGDLRYGPNIVCIWKEQNSLESYFNCHNSSDLALIEHYW